jgi:quercetin dioxygenase-like cupin family protein
VSSALSFNLLAVSLVTCGACSNAVPVTEEPHHRLVFENAEFRIFDVNVPPGMMTEEHSHAHDVATVSMSGGTDTRARASGEEWVARPSRPLGDVAVTEWAGKPGAHAVENVGQGPYHLFAVENLRTEGWSTAPVVAGLATTLASDGRAFKIYDVQLSGGRFQVSHVHPTPTLVLLINGKALSQGAEVKEAKPPLPSGFKQLDQPGQWVYIPAGEAHYVVRHTPEEVRVVEIEIR